MKEEFKLTLTNRSITLKLKRFTEVEGLTEINKAYIPPKICTETKKVDSGLAELPFWRYTFSKNS